MLFIYDWNKSSSIGLKVYSFRTGFIGYCYLLEDNHFMHWKLEFNSGPDKEEYFVISWENHVIILTHKNQQENVCYQIYYLVFALLQR